MNKNLAIQDLKIVLKSMAVSSRIKLEVCKLNQDYKKIVGHDIPYEDFGYQDLVEFLKSLSDVLTVNGNYVSAVGDFKEKGTGKKKRRRRRKKAPSTSQDQSALITKPQANSENAVSLTTNRNVSIQLFTQDGIIAHCSTPFGINFDMDIDYRNDKVKISTQVDRERIAAIRRNMPRIQFQDPPGIQVKRNLPMIQEKKEPEKRVQFQITERRELRFPRSAFFIEKNGRKIQVSPLHSGQTDVNSLKNENIPVPKQGALSTILENTNRRMNRMRNLPNIPGLKPDNSLQTKNLVSLDLDSRIIEKIKAIQNETTSPTTSSASIMDAPIPSSLPEVPDEFKCISNNLIDFDTVVLNRPLVDITPDNLHLGSRALPYMEAIKLVDKLQGLLQSPEK